MNEGKRGKKFGPERILTAAQPKVGSWGVAPENVLLPRPLVLRKRLFEQGLRKRGRGLRGFFCHLIQFFIEKEFITVHYHEII